MSDIITSPQITEFQDPEAYKEPLKFQELEVGATYHVKCFKPIETNFGKAYILIVTQNDKDEEFEIYCGKSICVYIKTNKLEKNPKKFDFIPRKIKKGKYAGTLYAEIDGFNIGKRAGFIELK